MAKAAKKKAVKAKPKRKPTKKAAKTPHLAESRRGRSKAQCYANRGVGANPEVSRLAGDLANTRKVVSDLAGSIGENLPRIHAAVQQLMHDHGNFRRTIGNRVGPMIGHVKELQEFRADVVGVLVEQAQAINNVQLRVNAIEKLLRS